MNQSIDQNRGADIPVCLPAKPGINPTIRPVADGRQECPPHGWFVRLLPLLAACFALAACNTQPRFTDPGSSAAHPIAKRSAFPQPGETIEQPIAAKRLSSEEQFALKIDPADIPAIVPWDQASKYVGYEITVEGRIVSVGRSNDGQVHFLNFHQDWRGKFYMVLFDDLARTLDQPVEQIFKDRLIRVRGKVQTYRGRPQVRILSMQQVEFVER